MDFDEVNLIYCKCQKMNFKRGGSDIDSLVWIKKEKGTKNQENEDDKWFQSAASVALSFEETGSPPDRVLNIKPFIDKYNWDGIRYPTGKDHWKEFEKNKFSVALNVLYKKEMEVSPAYISKHNSNREKKFIFLMIQNAERWHYLAVKKPPAFLPGITSKHNGDFIIWVAFILIERKISLSLMKKYVIM